MGDALGFRRGFHLQRADAVDSIRRCLLHTETLRYPEAVSRLLSAGYAVWDIVAASERAGSLDQDIIRPVFHDLRSLLQAHPSIRRIAFATGAGSARLFRRAWKEWLATPGAFVVADGDSASHAVFARHVKPAPESALAEGVVGGSVRATPVQLMVMESVRPCERALASL